MNHPRFKRSTTHLTYSTVHVSIPCSKSIPTDMIHFLYHELFIDLQKALIGVCTVSKMKNTENSITFKVEGILSVNYILKIVRMSHRYVYEIEIPLCLYPLKNELYKKCSYIMHRNNSVIYLEISNRVVFFLGGKVEDVGVCRLEIYKLIEEYMGHRVEMVRGKFNLPLLLSQGFRMYFGSFVNSEVILLSTDKTQCLETVYSEQFINNNYVSSEQFINNNYVSSKQFINNNYVSSDKTQYFEIVHLDSLKYSYLLLYKKHEIDDTLSKYSTYLSEVETTTKVTKVMFLSISKTNLNHTLVWFNGVYNSIIITNFFRPIYQRMDSAIVFDNGKDTYSTVVGDINKIKEIVPEGRGEFEAFMDVEGETLDFLCGKKNGKIIKIMKGLGCTIDVTKKTNNERSHVFIKGRLAVFKVALSMVFNEFPSHITFSIDERYHKRIIGYGGKNIQKMMKKHGVYIKFMSQSEMQQEGYEHNVVIKTPRKNEENLEKMKIELFETIEERIEKETQWKEVSPETFFTLRPSQFQILFDKFLVVEDDKIYYYPLVDSRDMNVRDVRDITLPTGQSFVKSVLRIESKFLTVASWVLSFKEKEDTMYVFTFIGHEVMYKLLETNNEKKVIDCKFLT